MKYVDITLKYEQEYLSPFAQKSSLSKGRKEVLKNDGLRTEFARDRDRILHSRAFRNLKHKTQVFISPQGDYFRTRLTHTIEVAQVARTIARALRLNEDLTEAIALGHDLGHTPYGHGGERALNEFTHFKHNEQSLRVVDCIESAKKGGMNLTHEVRDGILNHTSRGKPSTLEGQVVSWSDRIAYINHDIDDAIRAKIISENDIPAEYIKAFGKTGSKRINSMILDIIANSVESDKVVPSEEFAQLIMNLRQFMFERVYLSEVVKLEEKKACAVVKFLYEYFFKNFDRIPKVFLDMDSEKEQKVCDYIATMSDNRASEIFKELTIPKNFSGF